MSFCLYLYCDSYIQLSTLCSDLENYLKSTKLGQKSTKYAKSYSVIIELVPSHEYVELWPTKQHWLGLDYPQLIHFRLC